MKKLGGFPVPRVSIITSVRVSNDLRFVLIVGTSQDFGQVLTMIEWQSDYKVVFRREFLNSYPYKIRDIDFQPNSTTHFVTVGIQHLCFWFLSGDTLEYKVGELVARKEMTNVGHGILKTGVSQIGKFGMYLISNEY